jgi:short subunit dehydrogenase-like uncharacterized protein
MSEAPADGRYDLVLYGATGFTGGLVAEYLAGRAQGASSGPLRWALGGRSRAKLEAVRARLEAAHPAAAEIGVLEADTADPASLDRMAASARVLITTVGPFLEHGEPVAAACVRAGTDYVDITGEPAYVARLIERHDAEARRKGVLLVPCCGFDSIPADLGVLYTVLQLPAGAPRVVQGYVQVRGRPSGGSWASFLRILGDRELRRERLQRSAGGGASARPSGGRKPLRYEPAVRDWVMPMPVIDPLIVRRSSELSPAYGPGFRYSQSLQTGSLLGAGGLIVGMGALFAVAQIGPVRRALERALPSGAGPSEEVRRRSFFRVTLVGEAGGAKVTARVSGGDPGYDETSKMVAESALLLAQERAALPLQGGVATPASALGERLIGRLQAAGMRFETVVGPA